MPAVVMMMPVMAPFASFCDGALRLVPLGSLGMSKSTVGTV